MISQSVSLAFLGGALGPGELLLVFVVVLLLFGPRRLPEIAKTLGKMASEMRKASREFQDQVMKIEEELPKAEFASMLSDEPTPAALPPASTVDVDGVPVTEVAAEAAAVDAPPVAEPLVTVPLATQGESAAEIIATAVPAAAEPVAAPPAPAAATQYELALEPVKPGVTHQPVNATEGSPAHE